MKDNDRKGEPNNDAIYDILSDSSRRYLCVCLAKADRSVFTIEELVEQLVEWNRNQGDESISRKQVAIRLHHVHLPKLADEGIITYNPEKDTIQYDGNTEIEQLITVLTD